MTFCICVSGIKYRIRSEVELRLPEFAEYACPGEEDCGRAAEDAACTAAGCGKDCVDLFVSAEDLTAERAGDLVHAGERNLFKAAVLRKVALASLLRGRMLVHGACIAYHGAGYLFTAPSGTGKTTHIRLWKEHLGDAVTFVNGDKPILRIGSATGTLLVADNAATGTLFVADNGDSSVVAYGTPWAGKEGYQTNTSVPLAAIVEIVRSEKNAIRRVDKAQAFTWLYQHSYLGEKDAACVKARMNLVRELVEAVPVYALECDISEEAFACSFAALTGEDPANAGLK